MVKVWLVKDNLHTYVYSILHLFKLLFIQYYYIPHLVLRHAKLYFLTFWLSVLNFAYYFEIEIYNHHEYMNNVQKEKK